MPVDVKAFTLTCNGISPDFKVPVDVFPAFDSDKENQPSPHRFDAIWDTGATNTCISKRVVEACELDTIGFAQTETAGGRQRCRTFLINIKLITGAGFAGVTVTETPIVGADLLIGMDIITQGDFVITNFRGKTVFTFRTPSLECIDFLKSPTARFTAPSVGRNSKCPCGSGKKYKACCGK